ncbi:lectin subunit alpha-like [Contarinia nasturtii]|uniref:lectin subunit alpha-like n=1 Tax=Contarinia nasturtii TaxID=265458 RepID=UPI0012D37F25|nr:lectin subunit alpha-like [Contarinia nasturtii]
MQHNWFNAFHHCRSLGMHLVSITSQDQNDIIVKQIKDDGYEDRVFWTSGNGNDYQWMGNGKHVKYTNWTPGQPDNILDRNEHEQCIQITGKGTGQNDREDLKWNDRICSYNFNFICEQDIIE